jgi:dipeptidyl aminopeptidase/acylaminoacyl peptidase
VLLGAAARPGRELARWQRSALVASDVAAWPPAQRAVALARAEADAERLAERDPWLREWFALDPRAEARTLARRGTPPVLLLHGETDRQVPPAHAEELGAVLREGRARDVRVRRFPGTDHLFLEDFDGEPRGYVRLADRRVRADALRAVAEWVAARAFRTAP